MSLRDRHRSTTVRGLVSPSEWDGENNVSRVSILTFDDDEYEVEPLDAGRHLVNYAGLEVMARGHLAPEVRKRKVILVRSFTVFGPPTTQTIDSDLDRVPVDDAVSATAEMIGLTKGRSRFWHRG
jgi:hypothetical protein